MSDYINDPIESVFTDVGSAEPEEPKWVVKNILPTGITFLAGPPKSYKSTVELALCLTACGVENTVLPPDFCKVEGEPGIVMGLSMEAMPGVLRHTAMHGFGVQVPDDGRFLVVSDPWKFRLDQRQNVDELIGWAERLHPRILFIDPLRNCHSLDEKDSGEMVHMLQPLQQYAIKHDMALLVVHHSRKGSGEKGEPRNMTADDMRGSSALFGMADAVLTLTGKGVGLVHVDAILKRGEPWQRTIQLGIWGKDSNESIDSTTRQVFDHIQEGMSWAKIAETMHISKSKVSECVQVLRRMKVLDEDNAVAESGKTAVQAAVRKFAPPR